MKINLKTFIISGLVIFSTLFFNQKSSAQVTNSEDLDENRLVYWFYVSVREHENANTGYVSYKLQRKGGKIKHGTVKQYDRELWKNLGNGSKMAIGPFNDYDEAKKGFLFYEIQEEPHELDSTFDMNQQVFWFILHVNRRPRSNSYELIRKPGSIASGSYADFDIFLKENLEMRVMTIGPFVYMPEAEEAKRMYRLH